jgi:hypothetical protein
MIYFPNEFVAVRQVSRRDVLLTTPEIVEPFVLRPSKQSTVGADVKKKTCDICCQQ